MRGCGYYDGVFGSVEELKIPLSDRSVFFGDGVYDAAIGGGGEVFLFEEHIHRLFENARALSFPALPSENEIKRITREVILRSGLDLYFVYIQLSRALSHRTHSASECSASHLLITVTPYRTPSPDTRLKTVLREDLRYEYCNIKTINLLPNVLYSTEADRLGADEAILHRGGLVTECAHSNVSILKDGVLYTHPCDRHILPGITRGRLLAACESLGIPYRERAFSTEELFLADEVLISSTSKLLLAASEIDGIAVGGRDPLQRVRLSLTLFGEFFTFLKKSRKI